MKVVVVLLLLLSCSLIQWTRNGKNKQTHGDRKIQDWSVDGKWRVIANRWRVTYEGDKNVLKLTVVMLHNSEYRNKTLNHALFFFFGCYLTVCRILVPWPGTEPTPWAMKSWGFNHWTTSEFLEPCTLNRWIVWYVIFISIKLLWKIGSDQLAHSVCLMLASIITIQ